MILVLDASVPNAGPRLHEPANFHALKAVVSNGSPDSFPAGPVGGDLGRWEGKNHVWVDPALLVRSAKETTDIDQAWHQSFQEMLAYAEKSGWTDGDGKVRLHVEYS
ncbi:MAG: hypothetical protein ACQEXN_12300 [Actinomycetota bacterium]